MYQENTENRENLVDEQDNRDELSEQINRGSRVRWGSRRREKTMDGELLNHCRCHIVEGHMHWFCDKEVYRDRLVGLLEKEPFIELETKSSLDE